VRYEFEVGYDRIDSFDSRELDYASPLKRVGFDEIQVQNALKGISLINSGGYNDHYKTRDELERVTEDPSVVQRLIELGLIELHRSWSRALIIPQETERGVFYDRSVHKRHPQVPYRLSSGTLHQIYEEQEL